MEYLSNNYLLEYVGKTVNDKLRDEITKHISEVKEKAIGYTPRVSEFVTVLGFDNEKNPELTGLGSSILMKDKNGKVEPDLLTNQFGVYWAGIFGMTSSTRIMVDTSNLSQFVRFAGHHGGGSNIAFNDTNPPGIGGAGRALGIGVQIGFGDAGLAPDVKRTDKNLLTPFGSGNQASILNFQGGWNFNNLTVEAVAQVTISVSNVITAECGLMGRFDKATPPDQFTTMLAHDGVSPPVASSVGAIQEVKYKFQF